MRFSALWAGAFAYWPVLQRRRSVVMVGGRGLIGSPLHWLALHLVGCRLRRLPALPAALLPRALMTARPMWSLTVMASLVAMSCGALCLHCSSLGPCSAHPEYSGVRGWMNIPECYCSPDGDVVRWWRTEADSTARVVIAESVRDGSRFSLLEQSY